MARFQPFGTWMVIPPHKAPTVDRLGVPRKWHLACQPDPSERHWFSPDGRSSQVRYGSLDQHEARPDGMVLGSHLVIRAPSEQTAGLVQSLIHAGALLAYPDLERSPFPKPVFHDAGMSGLPLQDPYFTSLFNLYREADYGCRIAAQAWGQPDLIYAIEKYAFSLRLDWFTPHSAEPAYRQLFPTSYEQPAHHVNAAFAITAAFSVIEELGLEVRSSLQNPRFEKGSNRWNPRVREDLYLRLAAAGIDGNDGIAWVRRGNPTRVEREMRPRVGKPAPWARRFGVRDQVMTVIDAIHCVSWLRNYVASHKFKAITSAISPYDVHNCQLVARTVLLGRLGLWNEMVGGSAEDVFEALRRAEGA